MDKCLLIWTMFLVLAMVNILIILHAGWKIDAWIDKWTIAVGTNEQILQNMMDSIWINIGTLFMNAAMDKGVLQ